MKTLTILLENQKSLTLDLDQVIDFFNSDSKNHEELHWIFDFEKPTLVEVFIPESNLRFWLTGSDPLQGLKSFEINKSLSTNQSKLPENFFIKQFNLEF